MPTTRDPRQIAKVIELAGEGRGVNLNAIPVARARPSHDPGRMNKLEASWEQELKARPDVALVMFQAFKLRLADNTFYTPDFVVVLTDGSMEVHETKGFWRDDARVKWKVAAEQYPMFRFVAVTRTKKQWNEEYYR